MPIYEYVCEKCGKQKEKFQKVNDPAPTCCEKDMKKQLSTTSFVLSGYGWYRDGYSSKKEK
jgi:putative FmdB family regulatory protein